MKKELRARNGIKTSQLQDYLNAFVFERLYMADQKTRFQTICEVTAAYWDDAK